MVPTKLLTYRPNSSNLGRRNNHLWTFDSRPRSVYVAASVHNQNQAIRLALKLIRAGFEVTSRWLDFDFSTGSTEDPWKDFKERERCEEWGKRDVEDLERADTLVILTNMSSSSGGYHVELGYFLGKGRNVLVVGDKPNVFYWTDSIRYLPDDSGVVEFLAHSDHGKVHQLSEKFLEEPI